MVSQSYSSMTVYKDGVPVTEREGKSRRLVEKGGDVVEQVDSFKERPQQKKIVKSEKRRINEQSKKQVEETNTETKATTRSSKLKNLAEEEVEEFEKDWECKTKECKML